MRTNRRHDICKLLYCSVAITSMSWGGVLPAAKPKAEPNRWEKSIAAIEARDKESPPPNNGFLFVGSSSIRGWDLEKSFPDMPVINHGFGGSEIADSIHFADRLILPLRPKVVVVYAGDNDIARGKTSAEVYEDYRKLVKTVHAALPKTRIVFIAIKPSLRRWELVETMREANQRIRAATKKDDRLAFVDIDTPMIGADGRPRKELFQDDGLHLNAAGYALWAKLVRKHLK